MKILPSTYTFATLTIYIGIIAHNGMESFLYPLCTIQLSIIDVQGFIVSKAHTIEVVAAYRSYILYEC